MNYATLARKLDALLALTPQGRVSPLPNFGAVCCFRTHRLQHVSLVHPAAIFVLEGKKTLYRAEERFQVQAGGMFVLPSRTEVGFESEPDLKTGRYLALRLSFPEMMLARVLAGSASNQTQAPAQSLSEFLVDVDQPLTAVVGHVLDMASTCLCNDQVLALYLEAVLVLVAERTRAMPLLWDKASTLGSRVASLVSQDPARDWSAREVAGRLATSERSLRRSLEAEGTSLRQIFIDVRLGVGLGLLQTGRVSVGEAAKRCGYNSASRFAARFKARFGASPRDILRYGAVSGQHLAREDRTKQVGPAR